MKKLFSRKTGKGSVLLICFLFIGSAAIRIGIGAGQAVAVEAPVMAAEEVVEDEPVTSTIADAETLAVMLDAFQKREAKIEEMERKMAIRQKALTVADEEIERRLAELEQAEQSLRSLMAVADTAAEDDIARLTAVYENMKPKDAAALFEEMEPAFAAGFLGRMRADAAAGIMTSLSPEKAYTISVILAGRNANLPRG
ncbi:MotE family protein [Roseobacter sp. S98]|uniref:MotE family protein n=1 Tax=Roseobacter algicola (ex Choi et al. 2025) (nom. illeg.) TaxID=3092138 RepID=UPI003F514CA6